MKKLYLFQDEAIEETGWKLVHGDVFRPPPYSKFFCAFVATGVQLLYMAFVTMCKFPFHSGRKRIELCTCVNSNYYFL